MKRGITEVSTTIVCRTCKGEPQPLDAFSRQAHRRYGRRPNWKRCEAVRIAAWRERKKAMRAEELLRRSA